MFDTTIPQSMVARGDAGAEKDMLKNCKTMRPEIDKRLNAIAGSLEAALKASKAATSDW